MDAAPRFHKWPQSVCSSSPPCSICSGVSDAHTEHASSKPQAASRGSVCSPLSRCRPLYGASPYLAGRGSTEEHDLASGWESDRVVIRECARRDCMTQDPSGDEEKPYTPYYLDPTGCSLVESPGTAREASLGAGGACLALGRKSAAQSRSRAASAGLLWPVGAPRPPPVRTEAVAVGGTPPGQRRDHRLARLGQRAPGGTRAHGGAADLGQRVEALQQRGASLAAAASSQHQAARARGQDKRICLTLTISLLMIPLMYCHIKSFQRASIM